MQLGRDFESTSSRSKGDVFSTIHHEDLADLSWEV